MIQLRTLRAGIALTLMLLAPAAMAAVRVELSGVSGAERENVEAKLSIRNQAGRKDLDQLLVERLHEKAESDIRSALQPFGYYNPVVQGELSGQAPNWVAHYEIQPGPPTLIEKIDFQLTGEGAEHEVFASAKRRFERRLKTGERLVHSEYEEAKSVIVDAAYSGGFLDAHWAVAEMRVNTDANSAQLTLHMETGPRYYFGPTTVEQTGLDQKFIDRYVLLKEGDPYDPQKLLDQQFAFSDLGYFQTVEIEPQRAQADDNHHVPLLIRTTPRKRARYELGLGYGTDTGARATIGADWRRINRYGHSFSSDLRLSQIKNTAAGDYRIPVGARAGDTVSLTGKAESQELEDGDTSKYTVGAALLRTPGDWQRRLYLEFTHEESDFGATQAKADLLTPGVSYTRTDVDDAIFARRGWYAFMDVHGAAENVLASASFVRGYVQLKGVYSLDYRTRLLARVELGANFTEDFQRLPASQRFFAGGDQSVRGYAYQAIGRKDALGNVIGGAYLTTLSGEFERRVYGNWGFAVFADAGAADDAPSAKLHYGAGLGLRYKAPVGSIQIDLAHPFDKDESAVRLHVGVRVGL